MQAQESVYLDHAATTPLRPQALEAMLPYLKEHYGNPSAVYALGRTVRAQLDACRDRMAAILRCQPGELYFTSGGTEAINLALHGYARAHRDQGRHLLVSAIEHHAVLHAAKALADEGFEVEEIPVDRYGRVHVDEVAGRLRKDTLLVAVMHANNEIGTIQPIAELGKLCQDHRVALHVDAVQTAGHLSLMDLDHAAFISISAHKFGGPKGVGALVARRGRRLLPILYGGGQERELRAGTENVPCIVGMTVALESAHAELAGEESRLRRLAQDLRNRLSRIPGTVFNSRPELCLPHIVNVCFEEISGESLLYLLDRAGIAAASGSACSAGSTLVSHVLLAMGLPRTLAAGALRLSLGYSSTEEDIARLMPVLQACVERLRR
ncbi:MAG TPA: cysteine desulfurase [Firmicutes bacterium]|nr:cysteine desulfurase [Bacillota bacterium]